MATINDLKDELGELTTMKFVSGAFTEAAAFKLKSIRALFEKNRHFYEEISHIYHLIRINANKYYKAQEETAKKTTDKKTLFVALTSNKHFYGTLNTSIMTSFVKETEKIETNFLIIGSTGLEFLKGIRFKKPFEQLIFKEDNPNNDEASEFLKRIQNFHKVMIYYPKYVTLLSQGVGIIDITHTEIVGSKEPEDEIHIIFEPELLKIVTFFENQVRLMLFRRVLFETDIARTSARLISMSAAEERADTLIKEKKVQYRKALTSLINIKQLETFTGMSKWKKKTG